MIPSRDRAGIIFRAEGAAFRLLRRDEHQFVRPFCGHAHMPSPRLPFRKLAKRVSWCPEILLVEGVSPSQHLLNARQKRPLMAALLTSLLITEHCHDHSRAAIGTAF